MDEAFLKEVCKFMCPFLGNTGYHNSLYYDNLCKKYGKAKVTEAIRYIRENGSPFSFLK